KIVPEHLPEEYFHAVFRQFGDVGAARAQLVHAAHDDPVYAFHDHDVDAAIIPVDDRNIEQRRAGEIALQLGGVAGLAHEGGPVREWFFDIRAPLRSAAAGG